MTIPVGAISNTAVSLVNAVSSPSLSNIVAVAPQAAQIAAGNANLNAAVTNGANLTRAAATLLQSGSPFAVGNTINSAVRLAQGFLDPNTASTVGQVSGGLNQIFGVGGVLSPFGVGVGRGNKPVGLHTDSLTSQDMTAAFSEGNDVVFSFVRLDSGSASETGFWDGSGGIDWNSGFNVDDSGLNVSLSGSSALKSELSPLAVGTVPS